MRLLYDQPKVDNYQFAIYYLHNKKNPGMTKFIYNYHLVSYLTIMIRKIFQQFFSLLIIGMVILPNQV